MNTGIQLDTWRAHSDDKHHTQTGVRAPLVSNVIKSYDILSWFNFVSVFILSVLLCLHCTKFQWQEHTSSQRGLHSTFCIWLTYELKRDHIGRMTRGNNRLLFSFYFSSLIGDNLSRAIARPNLYQRRILCDVNSRLTFYFIKYSSRRLCVIARLQFMIHFDAFFLHMCTYYAAISHQSRYKIVLDWILNGRIYPRHQTFWTCSKFAVKLMWIDVNGERWRRYTRHSLEFIVIIF